ncbi:hypothetical protein [Pseudoalteromonas luteoviolacea]|uniref:Uncharacterized protein n=1 Tax=Pseudoalteromonas luteoviolacea S4054 TaxID=1129367 RepID=A0A0F6A7M3_9GAMM|nr:hypothetical protein [Pseudoalteromonas luteoviolacea]AOT06776.1 hypothetical protein S4054249_02290 [Pseudoalteromonas luteoviolacea]AOT11694.1 hypothetical protein S40542_02290 [Pseudoalteromonas luteoviolacea]AOT16606.1 hypothetical protein S4054_02290 [Pseudoalteromonas luteoviolacea]KKE82128.1 hypothetical protein N479_19625 [Pseudoalteromonas luteoviolacea S4054]KZN74122.1 hypothetical protein N481_10445 [Pseudoalteromonas luteoviolacea S4047-1]
MNYLEAVASFAEFGTHRDDAISIMLSAEQQVGIYSLSVSTFKQVLQRVIEEQISMSDLELWASVLLQREEYLVGDLEGSLYALSDPDIMGGIDKVKLTRLLALLD